MNEPTITKTPRDSSGLQRDAAKLREACGHIDSLSETEAMEALALAADLADDILQQAEGYRVDAAGTFIG